MVKGVLQGADHFRFIHIDGSCTSLRSMLSLSKLAHKIRAQLGIAVIIFLFLILIHHLEKDICSNFHIIPRGLVWTGKNIPQIIPQFS